MIKLAVFGDPISHSLSPTIHAEFAKQAGLAVDYTRIQASATEFAARFADFVQAGGIGANITLPLKEVAAEWADELSTTALHSGAVNTLIKRNNTWLGENTDGIGLVNDIARYHVALAGAKVLIVGAGGAARGVIPALLNAKVASIHVANRSPERADALVQHMEQHKVQGHSTQLTAGCLSLIPNLPYTIIINATSSGLRGEPLALSHHITNQQPFCYDMVYGEKPTPFMLWALSNDCAVADGLGMLVGQAAASFQLWTEVSPDVLPVLSLLRKRLGLWNAL